ncbi:alpha/beta hydrolase [Streptomyces asoensis]|uniref:alpha/beta fold hydrolase n=1 Tax=Streptomyces asoensis TaxID=249586 RepID=UPI0033C2BC61
MALVAGMAPGPARSANHPEGVDPELMLAGIDAFRRDRSAFFADGARAFFALDRPGNELSEAYVETMVRRCHGATARAGVAIGELIAALDVAPELAAVDLPVLVVHGTHDASGPIELTGRRAAALAPNATLEVYENAGHGLFATHADRLTADLRRFAAGE